MKLRNKKTGEIGEPRVAYQEIYVDTAEHKTYCYKTIAGLNEDWEGYKPAEPLIKDDKIRKAIRAWAEVNKIEDNEKVEYKGIYWKLYYSTVGSATIQFNVPLRVADGSYTITELCGEE